MERYSTDDHLKAYLHGRGYNKRPQSLDRSKRYKEHFTPTMGGCFYEVAKTLNSNQCPNKAIFGVRILGSVVINFFTGIGKGFSTGVGKGMDFENPFSPAYECFRKEIHGNVGGTSREWRNCETYFSETDGEEDASSEGEYAEVTDVYKKDNVF